MNQELQAKLRRLGVVRGARHLRPAPEAPPQRRSASDSPPESRPRPSGAQDLASLLPGGRLEATAVGACFVLDKVYPLTFRHGRCNFSELLALTPRPAALFCQDARLADLNFRDFLFLDTETTGLAGAGTLAFMVGVGFFDRSGGSEAFVVRQFFLRDHGDEPAMLELLDQLLAQKAGLITFNGRSFDLPLLDNRYLMNRLPGDLLQRPHIDLLHPARRLWRHRLGSCALSALEQNLLGVQRTHEDVPGWLIPALYFDYLRTGDARELVRVFYHNRLDMLSMVTLAAEVVRQFSDAAPGDHPIDLFSLGRWQIDLGLEEEAERSLRRAVGGDLPLELYHQTLERLGWLLKRNGRRREALPLWQQWAATSFDSVAAHVELAKHYEWHEREIEAAIAWTQSALKLIDSWSASRAALVRGELEHRLARLMRKR